MGTGDNAISLGLNNGGGAVRPHQQRILQQCKQQADQYLESLVKQVLDKLDETIFDRSTKCDDEEDANAYGDAIRLLGAHRPEISRAISEVFTRNYLARLNGAQSAATAAKKGAAQAGGLSLVDEHELEESLAVDGLVARARDRLRNELHALAQRFNAFIDGAHYDDESQPFDPEVIGYAFRDVIHKLDLKVEIKLIAYKLFEKGVMQTLEQFYQQMNSLLCDAGILPSLRPSVPSRSAGAGQQGRTTEHKTEQGGATAHDGDAGVTQGKTEEKAQDEGGVAASDVYQTLQKLMNVRKYGDDQGAGTAKEAGGGAAATGGSSFQADDLVRGLSLLQHETPTVNPGGAINVAAIKEALLGQMQQVGDGRGIHPAHDNTIDVIGMIFEFILDEPSIPDVVKNLLNQLQIPILKIALVDKEFFTNKNHPARRLLNVLGHASIGWNDNDEEARQRRFQKMEYIVNRVLDEFEHDPDIFAALLGEFIAFLTDEDGEVAVEVEAEPAESLGGDAEEVRPDRLAFEVIEARLDDNDVPAVLRDFLRNGWREVLQSVLDREGYESAVWHRHEHVIDDLMWSVEPKATADDRRKMVMLLPRLLDALREGMLGVGYSPQDVDALIDSLEPIHMACLRGEKYVGDAAKHMPDASEEMVVDDAPVGETEDIAAAVSDDEAVTEASPMPDKQAAPSQEISDFERELLGVDSSYVHEEVDFADEEPESIQDEFTTMAAEMALGTWLEFDLDDKKKRGKLAWKSVVMGEYVFVDRKYKVVAERTLAELAADLRNGKASLVEDVAMFDRALDKVLNGLMSGSRATH